MEPSGRPADGDPRGTSAAVPAVAPQQGGAGPSGSSTAHEEVLAGAEQVLDEIDRALVRLDEGTYGTCEVCGGAVDDEALAASPTVRTCRAHLPFADRT